MSAVSSPPTPTPSPRPPAPAPAPAQPAPKVWNSLFVIVPQTRVDATAADGKRYTVNAQMSPAAIADAVTAARRFEPLMQEWSGGNVDVRQDVVVADDAITRLSRVGNDKLWVSPRDAEPLVRRFARDRQYDNVFVIWRDDDPRTGTRVPGALGYTAMGRPDHVAGAGYSVVPNPDADRPWTGTHVGEIFVHEALHQVENYAKAAGVAMPGLHDNARFGFPKSDQNGSWHEWYRGLMQGTLTGEDGARAGLTREHWAQIAKHFPTKG